ncbi:cohesin domain-containing protein [Nostoc sp. TCL26-01]|uniref:cohesin domain-containing protein n=1 Tax=Nostoc sp. TCL26-01 TaxID=2576904 RepID=UPI0015B84F7C|nr:cohesin domain-containing protein [Nostoc sp. TCL26-01]QLE56857.1 hypothetical protein FD725_15860 [Nostoc sp. TCL26-01]
MRKSFWGLSLGLSLLYPTIIIPAAQAVSLELLPAVQTVDVGDSVDVDVKISELGDFQTPSLSGFALSLSFDPAILTFNSLSFGDPINGDLVGLSSDTRLTDIQTSSGLVNFAEISFDDPADLNNIQPASFILGRANFTALRPGISQLKLSASIDGLSDENSAPLSLTGVPIDASVTVTGTQVPEPNLSWWGLGLTIGLGTTITKKKRNLVNT